MVLQMENTRRSFDRSREGGAKKPRLAGEAVRGVNPNGRPFPQRPVASGANPVAQRLRNVDRDSESNGGYEPQSLQQRNQELVNQYKTALAELTFNSKPIITNLTIIAGENLHAAKAIAATICSHIIEVPSDQKLPSLYLLDSIVKNIARDYIKFFGARLPVVFCKAYRQVDPPVCQSMHHLFGTWKGVFPLQPLQMIEKELGFASANGSSAGVATSRLESQSQRTPHSIHVNPKYLERQRLEQSSRAKGMTNDTGAISNSVEDIEKPSRGASVSASRPWADAPLKLHSIQRRDSLSEPVHEKNVNAAYGDYEYGSDPPRNSSFGIGRNSGRVTDQGLEKTWIGANTAATETITSQRNSLDAKQGFPKYSVLKSADPRSRLFSTQNAAARVGGGMSSSWKNSEEEEFMWDDMNSKLTDHRVTNISNDPRKERWTPDEPERLGLETRLHKPQTIHDMGSRYNREIAADSLSSEQKEEPIFGHRMLSSLHESRLMDERILSQTGALSSGHSEGFRPSLGGLPTTAGSTISRTRVRTQLGSSHVGSSAGFLTNAASGSDATMGQQGFQSLGASSPTGQSPIRQNLSSPSRSNPQNQYIPDSLLGSLQKLQSQELQDSSHLSSSHQLRQNYSFSQQLQSDLSSVLPQKSPLPKVSNLGTSLKQGSSASNHSSSLVSEAPGQSITGRLTAVMNSGLLSNNSISASLPNLSLKDMGQMPSQAPPLSSGLSPPPFTSTRPQVLSESSAGPKSLDNSSAPKTVSQRKLERSPLPSSPPPSSLGGIVSPETSNSANPFSNLLSSLVSKGLISASKKETPIVVPSPTHLQNESPGISSTNSDLASTGPVSSDVPATDEVALSESAAISSALLTEPATVIIESLIGLEFKPEVIRELHPSVISGLFDDFPHQCSECGLRLKFEEKLDKHLEWHALKKPESLGLHRASRKWFVNSDNWVSGYMGFPDAFESAGSGEEEPAKTKRRDEPMVPADESQCACLLCGELFEDYYSIESDGWMFNGAVYMSTPSGQGTINGKAARGPIVHANCISESSVLDMGLTNAIKMEVDT